MSLDKPASELTKREYAAISLRVPASGNDELDKMIRLARRLDSIVEDESEAGINEWISICKEPSGEAGK